MNSTIRFQQAEAEFAPLAAEQFAKRQLPAALGPAIARQESGFIVKAQNMGPGDKERGGAHGLCQVTLATARALGWEGSVADLLLPEINCALAAELCVANMHSVKTPLGSDEWIEDIAAMYNSGKVYKNAPRITAMQYVPNVLKYFKEYATVYK